MINRDSSRPANACLRHVLTKVIIPRRTSAMIALCVALCWAIGTANAQTQNYFGTTGTLNGTVWSTNSAGPYTSSMTTTGGAVINFNNATTSITGASITVAGISATANATITSASGTISNFNNGHVPIYVAPGVTLDLGSQSLTGSGAASYRKDGEGVLATAGNTYGGGFTLNAGTVIVRGVNAFGSGGALTINGGTIAANGNRDLTGKYGGGIIVGGDFTLGATTGLASSTANLTFSNNVSLGATTRKITVGGTGTYTLGGGISGSGGLTVASTAAGTLVLSGTNTYAGPTIIQSGSVRFAKPVALYGGVQSNWTTANLVVQAGASAIFNVGGTGEFLANEITAVLVGTDFQTNSNFVLDTGNSSTSKYVQSSPIAEPTGQSVNLIKDGFNSLVLAAGSAYSGQTIIRNGSIQVGDDAAAGDLGTSSGVNVANILSTLRIQRAGEWTFPQQISGPGSFVHAGTATTASTAAHTYTGSTTVTGGELVFGGGSGHANGGSVMVSGASGARLRFQSSGTFTMNTGITVGNTGESGAVIHNEGSVNFTAVSNNFTIGAGGYGSYTLAGGALSTAGSTPTGTNVRIGATSATGQGIFTQTGGTMDFARNFTIGHGGGTGVVNILGGTITTNTGYGFIVGDSGAGSGTLNLGTQAGGDGTIVSQAINTSPGLLIGSNAAGVLNVNSGTLRMTAGSIRKGSASAALNLNGGTIQSGSASLSLIDSGVPVTVYRNGVMIDTQAHFTTLPASLSAASGSGIYPVGGFFTTSRGTGYIGAPLVTVAGGSGTGASAIAEVTNGIVTGVKMTSAGQNYVAGDEITFQFAGGGAASTASPLTVTLTPTDVAANGTGGLTKLGTGTLNLTGNSSYTGETHVNGGTLLVSGGVTGSEVWVASGATLSGGGTVRAAVIENGGRLSPGNGPGSLTVTESLKLDAGSLLTWQLSGTNQTIGGAVNDLVTAGALTLAGTLSISETTAGSFLGAPWGSRWRLMEYTGRLTDEGIVFGTMPNLAPGMNFVIDTSIAGQVNLIVVPEPTASVILLAGAGIVAAQRRRANKAG